MNSPRKPSSPACNATGSRQPSKRKTDSSSLQRYLTVLAKLLQQHTAIVPGAEQALGYVRSRSFTELYEWAERLAEDTYESAAQHFAANQMAALIKKYPWIPKQVPKLDPSRAALDKFDEAEIQCRKTNLRFSKQRSLWKSRFWPLLEDMRRWIKYVLGDEPDMDEIYSHCGHGTGAVIGVHGNATSFHRKMLAEKLTCTPMALRYAQKAMWRNPHISEWFLRESQGYQRLQYSVDWDSFQELTEQHFASTDCNKVSFVPKTAKTHRAIAVEPLLNTYVQRGVDYALRRKLEKVGRFLDYQMHNSELARIGSINGRYATLDLSSASDTVARALVYYLLPPSWFRILNDVRSPKYSVTKQMKRDAGVTSCNYEKFSSMGNNFTFPLETLIFAAAARASMRASDCWGQESWAVYGDDIIVPTPAYDCLSSLLRFCGFTPNPAKSFSSGPFRESCGGDWYSGQDVRPVELDYHLLGTTEIMIFHNACQRSERALEFFESILPFLREEVVERERFCRPIFGYTGSTGHATTLLQLRNLNGAFSVPMDVAMTSRHTRWSRSQQRWTWKEFQFSAEKDRGLPPIGENRRQHLEYIAFLSGMPDGKATLRYTTERRVVIK